MQFNMDAGDGYAEGRQVVRAMWAAAGMAAEPARHAVKTTSVAMSSALSAVAAAGSALSGGTARTAQTIAEGAQTLAEGAQTLAEGAQTMATMGCLGTAALGVGTAAVAYGGHRRYMCSYGKFGHRGISFSKKHTPEIRHHRCLRQIL